MKYLKMLGLAAVAAMALTAFFGASSASATVLCTTTPAAGTACGTGWHVDEVDASAVGEITLANTNKSIEATCTVATSKSVVKIVNDEGGVVTRFTGSATTTPIGEVTPANLTWGAVGAGCSNTTDTVKGGELEIHWTPGTSDGTVTASGFQVTVVLAGVSCTLGLEGTKSIGELTGGKPAIMHVGVGVVKKAGSFLCPSTGTWEGTYEITNHTAVYVAEK
jgi:hypothetical protein